MAVEIIKELSEVPEIPEVLDSRLAMMLKNTFFALPLASPSVCCNRNLVQEIRKGLKALQDGTMFL